LYSQRDIDKIKLILRLTRELGVNLAGVDIILRLKVNVEEMEEEISSLKYEVMKAKNSHVVSPDKALVAKKSIYEMIIFQEKKK